VIARPLAVAAAVAALAAAPAWAAAQQVESGFRPEWRGDLFFATATTMQAGGGGAWALDRDVRLVALGGIGTTVTSGAGRFSARVDLLAGYLLDPELVDAWSLYGRGGLSLRYEATPSWKGAVVALVGAEGPNWGSWRPFVELGYGGGLEIGFGLRRSGARAR